jgi:hypothetical protein
MKTQMVRLVALGREGSRQVYGTRRLVAGDEFDMRRDVADILIRTGRAKLKPAELPTTVTPPARPPGGPPPAPVRVSPEPAAPPPAEPVTVRVESGSGDIEALRAQAAQLGLDVDRRWGIPRLQYEISRIKR